MFTRFAKKSEGSTPHVEAVSVILVEEDGEIRIRELDWGDPEPGRAEMIDDPREGCGRVGGMSERPTRILEADLSRPEHQAAIILMVDAYARDPMGDGESLSRLARQNLIQGLREHPTTLIFLAYQETEPVGIAVCFRGFSTFAARPLVNISDYFVYPAYRGTGVGRQILAAVEARAREMGCCRLTLEVQENNQRAKAVYTAAGFSQRVHAPELGGALYLAKELR